MASLEDILKKVVLSDSEQISEGTEALRTAFKSQTVVPQLCNVLGTSEQVQIRQYAAVLLRKHLGRKKIWLQLPVDIKKGLKEGLIQALIQEPEKSVKNSIAQLIGTIVKHLKTVNQQWPELLEFLQQSYHSNNPANQELGALALAGIADISIDSMSAYLPAMCLLFKHVLENTNDLSQPVVYHSIMAMKLFVPALEHHKNCVSYYGNLVPQVLVAAHAIALKDEARACQELELLEDLLDGTVSAISPHLSTIITTCLQMALDQTLGNDVRVKAILITGWIARKKKKVLLKMNLIRPMVDTFFQLMSTPSDTPEDDEDYVSAQESNNPGTIASQTMDILALCLPPDKLIPLLAEHIEPAMQGDDIYKKKAGYITLSVIVEGCQAYIRNNCLEPFINCIGKGIEHPSPIVRNAALFALGQFSDYLQPEITKYAPALLPVLFTYLDQLCSTLQSNGKEPAGVDRMFYALEAFIENLGKDLLPYLPVLMERLLLTMDPNRTSPHLRELALSSLGSAAHAVGEHIMPYFSAFIEVSKNYLTQHFTDEANIKLQVQALDSLGMMARAVGRDNFLPLSRECVQLGLTLIRDNAEEVDLRKSAYGLFAALATILKEDMTPELTQIMPLVLQSVKSNDGIETHFKDEDKAFPVYEEVREELEEDDISAEYSDEDDDINSDLEGYSLKNSYIEEKEEALIALKEFAVEAKDKFSPYLKESFDVVYQALSYPHDDVKSAAIGCMAQICINWYRLNTPTAHNELREALLVVVPKLAELVHCDPDHEVVMAALDLYSELLKELKGFFLQGQGHKEAIINCIKDVLKCNTEVQKQDGGENEGPGGDDEEDDGDEAEQDEMLFEYAAEVLTPLGHAMQTDEFVVVFKDLLPILINRTKKKCSLAQRSFCTGMLAECMSALGPQLPKVLRETQVLSLLLKLSVDKEQDVCNNAIYGLGEMAKHGKDSMFPHYQSILNSLSETLKVHSGAQLLDNVCGCIARLIVANIQAVPLNQVLPVFMKHLPLREDNEEIKPVFECIVYVYSLGRPELVAELQQVVVAAADVIGTDKTDEETQLLIVNLVKNIRRDFNDQFNSAVNTLSPEVCQRLQIAIVQ